MASDADDVNDPLIGRVLDGRFTVQSVLGRGGMGVVYRARQSSLERSVALKVMRSGSVKSDDGEDREAEFQRRFFLEAATVAKLKHPNTITVFDYGSTLVDGERVFFIAMELLEGTTLAKLVSHGRALPPLRAVHVGMQICRSLREAHKAGVVHRDLKPGNVMVVKADESTDIDDGDGDFVKVLDFGLAKTRVFDGAKPIEGMTKAGTFMGSPRYVAPEQVEGRAMNLRADIYSFGCLMYRLLAGQVPFDGKAPVEIMLKHLNEEPPELAVPGVPRVLVELVMQCLEKEAQHRPRNMDEVLTRMKLAKAELTGRSSGIHVVSDDRMSIPEAAAVSEPPRDMDPLPMTRADRRAQPTTDTSRRAHPSTDSSVRAVRPVPHGDAEEQNRPRESWTLGAGLDAPLGVEDSTRPTRILGHMSRLGKPPRRPWAAISVGIVLGVALMVVGAHRLGLLDDVIARAQQFARAQFTSFAPPVDDAPMPASVSDAAPVPFAKTARLRITTDPAGADVLEERDGLPRLLGTTPLTITWDVAASPKPRRLTLRKAGFVAATAVVQPPRAGEREPVWLEVAAQLRTTN